jgi:hypothetical protein
MTPCSLVEGNNLTKDSTAFMIRVEMLFSAPFSLVEGKSLTKDSTAFMIRVKMLLYDTV